jgi:transcriptional/translational regulatory protein YebC/TACO1
MNLEPFHPRQGETGTESVSRLRLLVHLASVIDVKRDKLESAITKERQRQLASQLDFVMAEFQQEYETFLQMTEPMWPPTFRAA